LKHGSFKKFIFKWKRSKLLFLTTINVSWGTQNRKAEHKYITKILIEKSQLYSLLRYCIFLPFVSSVWFFALTADRDWLLPLPFFTNNDAPVKYSRGAPARTAPNPPRSTCLRSFNLDGRMQTYWRWVCIGVAARFAKTTSY